MIFSSTFKHMDMEGLEIKIISILMLSTTARLREATESK